MNDSLTRRTAAQAALQGAARMLREVATDLELFAHVDAIAVDKHGEEYAQSETVKVTLRQRVDSATADLARAQQVLTLAVFEAAAA